MAERVDLGPQRSQGLVDILDRVLDKGLVVAGDIKVNLANVELLTIRIRLLVCSIDKAESIGMNWWRTDPAFGGNDHITTGTGRDIVFGGPGNDVIAASAGETAGQPDRGNIVFGDQGYLDYVSADHDARDIDVISSGDLLPLGGGITGVNDTASAANSVDVNTGGDDTITTGLGNDVIVGGAGADTISTGNGQGLGRRHDLRHVRQLRPRLALRRLARHRGRPRADRVRRAELRSAH